MLRNLNFRVKKLIFTVICDILQILHCLSAQGLTSSGGGSNPSAVDGGNSSGASRAMVKDRYSKILIVFHCNIVLDLNQQKCLK